jgi:hypothetical protein
VTGANMFSRYLGQSLGAALFGAVFNAAIAGRLSHAPASAGKNLPTNVNDVIGALHDTGTGSAAGAYLRHSIDLATRHLFLGMAVISVLVLLVIFVIPRDFPIVTEEKGEIPLPDQR